MASGKKQLRRIVRHLLFRMRYSENISLGDKEFILESPTPREISLFNKVLYDQKSYFLLFVYQVNITRTITKPQKFEDILNFWNLINEEISKLSILEGEEAEKRITDFLESEAKFFDPSFIRAKVMPRYYPMIFYFVDRVWPLKLSTLPMDAFIPQIFSFINIVESSRAARDFLKIIGTGNWKNDAAQDIYYEIIGGISPFKLLEERLKNAD